ncbi:AAA family ATPase [Helicobacter pylori]|uniref:AAA family ATPase n=1 Tax=Helicobacter pylori TaxID=210 RepID=UPI00398F1339
MKLYKRVLKLHQFKNLGKNLPTELLLNSSFEKHGELVILVGENNVGKSNILEALKAFNDTDIKLCNEKDYFKAHESEDAVLSLEEETSRNNETIDFSCVDLKIQTKEIGEGLKELSKTLIVYPFEKHVEALEKQCSKIVFIPINNNDYSNICTFVSNFKNLIDSYNRLKPFLHFYKELIKYVSGNSEWIKTFCQCVKEIIKHNTPNKKCNSDDFFVMGKHKQNQLSKIYSRFKELNGNEIKTKYMEYISKKIKSLDEIFKTTDFNTKFTPKTEVKDIIKEIDEKYPINENFKKQFEEFESNIKNLDEMKKDFEQKKESLILEIEDYCKNQKTLEFNYDVLLDNIQQTCKEYIASHVINNESKDMKSMMCQFYLKQIDLLANSEIEQYRYIDFFESARKSLWENIKTLDEKSGVHLFPQNIDEIKQKFEANKEKFQQSKNYSEFAKYCRECNPYTAFQGLRNRVNFPLKNHSLDKFVPTMKEYKELKITDNDLKTALLTRLDYSSPSEFDQSDWFFRNSLFRKMDFHPNTIWDTFGKILNYKNFDQKDLKYEQALEIMFDKNNDLEVYSIEFFNDKSSLLFKINFTEILENIAEILEYNMQSRIDSLIAKEFNELLVIAQDDHQDNYQLKIRVRHNNKFFREKCTAYKIKLEIYDCRKSDNQKPIILS